MTPAWMPRRVVITGVGAAKLTVNVTELGAVVAPEALTPTTSSVCWPSVAKVSTSPDAHATHRLCQSEPASFIGMPAPYATVLGEEDWGLGRSSITQRGSRWKSGGA